MEVATPGLTASLPCVSWRSMVSSFPCACIHGRENNFKPQIITEAIHLELDGLDMESL